MKFHLGVSESEIDELLDRHGLEKVDADGIRKIGYVKVWIPDGRDEIEVTKALRKEYRLKVTEPNYVSNILTTKDPLYSQQWYVQSTNFDKAWGHIENKETVKVAVIDTGVDRSHPDLQGRILSGYDFVSSDDDASDDNGHGTFVSGIIAANANDIGIRGLYDYAQVIPVKVIDNNGIGTYEDVAAGVIFAADNGARVINMSIGGYAFSYVLQDAIDYAFEKGCIVVAAGGNDGIEQPVYPAAYPDVIGVSATGIAGQKWPESNNGKHIDICAPGVNIISTGSVCRINSWNWDFGDGASSNEPNPTHTYSTPGIYTVRLMVAGAEGVDTESKSVYIQVFEPILSVTPTVQNIASSGGTLNYMVENTGTGTMPWTVLADVGWITIDSGASGTDSGTISITVAENTGDGRTGHLTITASGATGSPAVVEIQQDPGPGAGVSKIFSQDGEEGDDFGYAAAADVNRLIVGVPYEEYNGYNSGSAYVFTKIGDAWVQQGKLNAADEDSSDSYAYSVGISGDYAIVGSPCDDNHGGCSGSAYIFNYDGSSWVQEQKLTSDETGSDYDVFGRSVSVSGDYILVGAPGDDGAGANEGAAYVYHNNGVSWIRQAKLTNNDGNTIDAFGTTVSITENHVIVGAQTDDENGSYAGAAYLFKRDGISWQRQPKIVPQDGISGHYFGCSTAISNTSAIVGAYGDDDLGSYAGVVYAYELSLFDPTPPAAQFSASPTVVEGAGCTDPNNADTDGDGILDGDEDINHNGAYDAGETDPCSDDTDGDAMPDGFEVSYGLDPLGDDSLDDSDGDGFCNLRELLSNSAPDNAMEIPAILFDGDSDGNVDGAELFNLLNEISRTDCDTSSFEYDLNGDGAVDEIDLFLFCEDYGRSDFF